MNPLTHHEIVHHVETIQIYSLANQLLATQDVAPYQAAGVDVLNPLHDEQPAD